MIIEQAFATGTTAWLAAVGLAHLTKAPMSAHEVALAGGVHPSRPSRWVQTGSAWSLEIDQACSFQDLLGWFENRFGPDFDRYESPHQVAGRDPWWRLRGNSSVYGIGRSLYDDLVRVAGPVDLVEELKVEARALRTDKALGWVIDRQWAPTDPDQRLSRPLIRYALAYVGATVAQHWPGHMIGNCAVGHLWDGQPEDHPLGKHTAIIWTPVPEPGPAGKKYPPWWVAGHYATIPAATWPQMARDRWFTQWLQAELLGRTDAKKICPDLPAAQLTRSRVPLWLRSKLLRYAADQPSTAVRLEVSATAAPVTDLSQSPSARAEGDTPLDAAGVAEHTSLSLQTIRSYVRDGAMPPHDGKLGQTLWWWSSTIDDWQLTRPTLGRRAGVPANNS